MCILLSDTKFSIEESKFLSPCQSAQNSLVGTHSATDLLTQVSKFPTFCKMSYVLNVGFRGRTKGQTISLLWSGFLLNKESSHRGIVVLPLCHFFLKCVKYFHNTYL